MKLKLLVLAALLTLFCEATIAADSYPPVVTSKNLYADNDFRGKTAPKLEVQKWLNGDAPKTEGKVVLIDFWATWCGPCRRLIPELNGFKEKFGDDLVVIGISDEPEDKLKQFISSNEIKYAMATDTDKKMKKKIGVKGIPHVMIISPDNIVRWQGFPGLDEDPLNEEVIAKIIAASKGK